MSKRGIALRVIQACVLLFVVVRMTLWQRTIPHAPLTAMQRDWIGLVLLLGVGLLFVVFGTKALVDWNRLRGLRGEAMSKAVPLWVGLVAALGLACTAFAVQALFFY